MKNNNEEGMALLLTLAVISLLVVVTIQFYKAMYQHYASSVTYRDSAQLSMISLSGTNFGMALLKKDGESNAFDSLVEDWAVLGKQDLSEFFNRGVLKIEIQDLSGRIPINSLVGNGVGEELKRSKARAKVLREIFIRLLLSDAIGVEDENEAREIVDGIVDWIDEDNSTTGYGGEDDYYQSLEKPYKPRNGKILFIEELLYIKGINKKIFYGDGQKKLGLKKFVTVYGDDGKININTAPLEVVKALHPMIPSDTVVEFDEYRQEEGNSENLLQVKWYLDLISWPNDVALPEQVLTNKSSFFQIVSDGVFQDFKRRTITYVRRDDQGKVKHICQVVEQ